MGSGFRIKQYERRFFEGEQKRGEREEKAFHTVGIFGEHEVRESKGGGYELLKSGEVVGIFPEARIEESRVIFKLSHGMNLEVSEERVRETFSPERAELCGLMASDGCVCKYQGKEGKSFGYEVSLTTVDYELVGIFKELFGDIYSMMPHEHLKQHKTKEGEKEHYYVAIYSKQVAYDLWNFGIKGPGPYEFHPPTKYLDDEGKRAYLRGFFSGDGNISMTKGGRHNIRIYSKCKEGLSELRELFIDLGFHPGEIKMRDRGTVPGRYSGPEYSFTIPEEDHLRFIEEIGSEREEHKRRLQLIKAIDEEKKRRKEEG